MLSYSCQVNDMPILVYLHTENRWFGCSKCLPVCRYWCKYVSFTAVGLALAPSLPLSLSQSCSYANKHPISLHSQRKHRRHFHLSVTSCWTSSKYSQDFFFFFQNVRCWQALYVSGYPVCWHVNAPPWDKDMTHPLISGHLFWPQNSLFVSHTAVVNDATDWQAAVVQTRNIW